MRARCELWRNVDCVRSQMRWQLRTRERHGAASPRARPPRRDARRPLRLPPRSPATDDRASARGSTCAIRTRQGRCTATAGRASRLPRSAICVQRSAQERTNPFACLPAQKMMSRTHADDEHAIGPEDEDGDGHREMPFWSSRRARTPSAHATRVSTRPIDIPHAAALYQINSDE